MNFVSRFLVLTLVSLFSVSSFAASRPLEPCENKVLSLAVALAIEAEYKPLFNVRLINGKLYRIPATDSIKVSHIESEWMIGDDLETKTLFVYPANKLYRISTDTIDNNLCTVVKVEEYNSNGYYDVLAVDHLDGVEAEIGM